MKNLRRYLTCIVVLVIGLFASCSHQDKTLNEVFNNNQLVTINRIIDFYDNFVLKQTGNKLSIDKAYEDFLSNTCPVVIETGNINILLPERKERLKFFKSLDKEALKEIYIINDTVSIYNSNERILNAYQPFSFNINMDGKYFELLEILSKRNDFFKSYFEFVETSGGLNPQTYSHILKGFRNIDFTRKEERLVLIVSLLYA